MATDGNYEAGFEVFMNMFETGEWPLTEEQLAWPIAFVQAVEESLERDGEAVEVTTES